MAAPAAALTLETRIAQAVTRHRAGALTDAEFAAHVFLHWQIDRYGARFASRRLRTDARPDVAHCTVQLMLHTAPPLQHWFASYQFTGVNPNVSAALLHWLRGEWAPTLRASIPSSGEVLRMQVAGTRPVTVLADPARMRLPVMARADAFEFLQHDLEHVYQFYHSSRLHAMQRGLFFVLDKACAHNVFAQPLLDPVFATRFDYLISDMNTHPLHSLHYLRAQLVEHHLRAEYGGVNGPLSVRARSGIRNIFAALADCGDFGVAARAALAALSDGSTAPEQASVLEKQLIELAYVQRLHAAGAELRVL